MKWGTPTTYAWLWKVSGPTYKNELMFWLQTENPSLYQMTMKEIGREGHKVSDGKAGAKVSKREAADGEIHHGGIPSVFGDGES